jgi:Family of unknown function (DUF6074)
MKPASRARMLAFPLNRRSALVRKLAAQMLSRSPAEAEAHLAFERRRHRRLLTRRQIPAAEIDVQIRALQAAVRAELWRLVMAPPLPRGGAR